MRLKFKEIILKLVRLNSTPHGIALGVATGVFIGMTPLYGLHTAMVILAALFVPRTNKIAILAGTNISLPPTMPFITWGGYETGRFILQKGYPPLSWSYFSHITFQNIGDFYYPLFVGSLVLGAVFALVFYVAVFKFVERYQSKQHK